MSPALIAVLFALLVVRTLGALAFVPWIRKSPKPRHSLLIMGWLVYAAAPAMALVFGFESPLFGAAAVSGLLILLASAFAFFRPVPALPVMGTAASVPLAMLLLEQLRPSLVPAIAPAVQVIVLFVGAASAIVARRMFLDRAPRSFIWLMALIAIGAVHSMGFLTIYPPNDPTIPLIGTLVLSSAGIVLFLSLESEMESGALAESEERFRAVFEQSSVGIVEADLDGRILMANRALLGMLRYSAAELAGVQLPDLVAQEDRSAAAKTVDSVLSREQSQGFIEVRGLRRDGSTLWVALSVSLSLSAGGLPAEVIVIVKDIDTRKRVQAELDRHRMDLESLVAERTRELEETNEELQCVNTELESANEELERANSVKADFMAKMSHELRTPLNSVIGFTGTILQGLAGPITEEQEKQLQMAHDAGRHLLELVNDILDLSKLEARHLQPHNERFSVGDLCSEIAAGMQSGSERKGLTLRVDCEDQNREIVSDRRLTYQILANLLGNAIKFTTSGEISCVVRDSGPDAVAIHVIDSGPGIPGDYVARIFEPFVQLNHDGAVADGTGLGLAISKQLAALLGGTLTVTSTVGKGSDFCLTLPVRPQTPIP